MGNPDYLSTDTIITDPSQIVGNVNGPFVLNTEIVQKLQEIFDYNTGNISFLYADERSALASARFAKLTMGLLAEVSTTQPDLINTDSQNLQLASHRYGLIDKSIGGSRPSFFRVPEMHTSDEVTRKMQEFLTEASLYLQRCVAKSDNAHTFHSLAQSAFGLLDEALKDGTILKLAGDSPVAKEVADILNEHEQETAQAQARRAGKLEGTIFGSEARPEGVQQVELQTGTSVRLDWGTAKPLLDEEQTYVAFFERCPTDLGGLQAESIYGKTVATLEIDAKQYVVVDTRAAQKIWPRIGQLNLLQILGDREDPLYGVEVSATNYDFQDNNSGSMEPVYDHTDVNEQGFCNPTGVMIGVDKKGRLVIDAVKESVRVTAAEGALKAASAEQLSSEETFGYQEKELRKRLNDSMSGGKSSYDWAPDLLADLNQSVEGLKENGGVPEGELSVRTYADLLNPRIWRNNLGEMDTVNLFLGNMGMVNLDYVLGVVQDHVNQELSESHRAVQPNGVVNFESGIPGVRTAIRYGYSPSGNISYIKPEILIDPKVEVAA